MNSAPLSLKYLHRKRVIVVTFINMNTAASLRTLPTLQRWWKLYALEGLMIIGVHTPDYMFGRDPLEVRKSIERIGIKFPVIIDTERKVWEAYRNEGWPAHYLIDHKGRIIYDRLGEGRYAEFEEEILYALKHFRGYKPDKSYRIPPDPPQENCRYATRGFYLGSRRGKDYKPLRPERLEAIVKSRDGEVSILGPWRKDLESLRYVGPGGQNLKYRMRLIYQGAEALAVLVNTGDSPGRMYLKQDNLWLHAGNASTDVKWDDDDRSYVEVDSPRLYHLTRNRKGDMFELLLMPESRGLGVAGFEFSDYCQVPQKEK